MCQYDSWWSKPEMETYKCLTKQLGIIITSMEKNISYCIICYAARSSEDSLKRLRNWNVKLYPTILSSISGLLSLKSLKFIAY